MGNSIFNVENQNVVDECKKMDEPDLISKLEIFIDLKL